MKTYTRFSGVAMMELDSGQRLHIFHGDEGRLDCRVHNPTPFHPVRLTHEERLALIESLMTVDELEHGIPALAIQRH